MSGKTALAVLCMLLASVPSPLTAAGDAYSHRTVFIRMTASGLAPEIVVRVNDTLAEGLRTTPHLLLLPHEEYADRSEEKERRHHRLPDRAFKIGALRSADRVITGTISLREKRTLVPLGRENAEQYLLRPLKDEQYVITIELIDVHDACTIVRIHEKTTPTGLNRSIRKILAEIARHYRPKKSQPAAPAILTPEKPQKRGIEHFLSASPSAIVPLGMYGSVADYGAGFAFSAGAKTDMPETLSMRFLVEFHRMHPQAADIDSYNFIQLCLLAGYSMKPHPELTFTPMAGAGYLAHHLKNRTDHAHSLYLDPHVCLYLDIARRIGNDVSLFALPGTVLFFEKDGRFAYLNIQAGVRKNFNTRL